MGQRGVGQSEILRNFFVFLRKQSEILTVIKRKEEGSKREPMK